MADSYYAIGYWANMARDTSQLTVASEDSLFLKENLVARAPGKEFRFAAAAADDIVTVDLSVLLNPGFEDWTLPTVPDKWEDLSNGTGALEEETGGDARTGSALRLNGGGGGNEAIARQRFSVMGGWEGDVETFVKSTDASPVIVRIRLLETGQWLDSAGAWQNTIQDWETNSSGTYVQQTGTITIPEASSTLHPTMTLEVEVRYEGSGLGFADDFGVWFDWDLMAVFGHNLDTLTMISRVETSTAPTSGFSTEVDPTIAVPAFYNARSVAVTDRFFRLKAVGTNHEPIRYGELFVTQRRTHARNPDLPHAIVPRLAKVEVVKAAGRRDRIAQEEHASQDQVFEFRSLTATNYRELLDNVLQAGEWGGAPGLVVPDSERDEVIHATFGQPQIVRQSPGNLWRVTVPFEGSAYATRVR